MISFFIFFTIGDKSLGTHDFHMCFQAFVIRNGILCPLGKHLLNVQAITIQYYMKSSRNYIYVTNTCVAQLVESGQKPPVEGFCGELGLGRD